MSQKIALCANSESLNNPKKLGLENERILDQTWILPFADALIARKFLQEHAVEETWVVSSNSVDGINLAAALKKDNQKNTIKLFLSSPSGSKMSRCQNAGIVPICGNEEFARLYRTKKHELLENVQKLSGGQEEQAQQERLQQTQQAQQERLQQEAQETEENSEHTEVLQVNGGTKAAASKQQQASQIPAKSSVHVQRIERSTEPTEAFSLHDANKTSPLKALDTTSLKTLDNLEIEEAPETPSTKNSPYAAVPKRKSFDARGLLAQLNLPNTSEQTKHAQTQASVSKNSKEAIVVSVLSGSGGTGKSSITALCALLAQKRGLKTLVLDADFQFGDQRYLLGYKQTLDASDIFTHPEQIETLLKADTWPALLAAPEKLEYSEILEEKIGQLLAYLRPHFDLIVVNTGAFWCDLQLQLLELSNNVFFVVDQRPSSVRACNHALDLCARCGIATTSFSYLLNFCSKKSLLSSIDVSCALKGAKVYEIKDGGSEVAELLGAGMAHKLSTLNNPFTQSMEKLLKQTLYERAALPTNERETSSEKQSSTSGKPKMKSRAKRRAACF